MPFDLIRGAQLDPSRFRAIEHFQGYFASLGVNTVLPFVLKDAPKAASMMRVFVGTINGGDGYLQRRGVDWDINLATKQITWLSTARIALDNTKFISVVYMPYGHGTANALAWQ